MNQIIIYDNIISLGGSCVVASELERFGLRDASYPFDWIMSSIQGVEACLDQTFAHFLTYDYLYQSKNLPSAYWNKELNIKFFHDFSQFIPLNQQHKKISQKYSRRIDRFYNNIKKPTLFVRYLYMAEQSYECEWWQTNYDRFLKKLKNFNPNNNLIIISNDNLVFENKSIPVFYVPKDDGKEICEHPLDINMSLQDFLIQSYLPKRRDENLKVFQQKCKKVSIFHRILIKFKRILYHKKTYIHNKVY